MTHMKRVLRLFLVSMLLVHLLSGMVLAGTLDKVRDIGLALNYGCSKFGEV